MRKSVLKRSLSSALLAAACFSFGLAPARAADAKAVADDIAKAEKLAGNDLRNVALLCYPNNIQVDAMWSLETPAPSKIFDNMYYLGFSWVGAFAITTSQGIILIDSTDSPAHAEQYIVQGLKKLGLDPMTIKYIIISHGAPGINDHGGGAKYLQDKIPGIHIVAGDWNNPEYGNVKPAPGDLVTKDGMKITLGDETVTVYSTPGHSAGTTSVIMPVKDHGVPHVMAMFGGTSFNPDRKELMEFKAQLDRFRQVMKDAHADGRLSTHPLWSNTTQKIEAQRQNPGGPNPFVESSALMDRYAQVQDLCFHAILDGLP